MPSPRLVVAGASGVVGRALVEAAREAFDVTVLTRRVRGDEPPGARVRAWNPRAAAEGDLGHLKGLARELDGASAVVNLAGASIDAGRFGNAHKNRIVDSRVHATTTLVRAAKLCPTPPAVWLQGSAVGYYGDRGEQELREGAAKGDLFISDAVAAWEAAAHPAGARSRLAILRTGLVFDRAAPAWRRMILPIRLFAGGPLAGGRQWWAWIHGTDLARAMLHVLRDPEAEGIYNLCAPEPVRQVELARAVARRLRRPALLPAPAWALRLALGGLADALILPSARAVPARLARSDFTFRHPNLASALDELLA